jgi:hypothetical protein
MTYRAMFAYPWDLAEDLPGITAELRDLGLDTITFAGAYHAGKFLRPHGRSGKVYFPEDGTAYFRADPSRYGAIKPQVSRITAETDVLDAICKAGEMAANAWLVLMHNTRLGMLHPEATVANAFGDRIVYNLCPSAPAAREYAVALCKDVSDRYPVRGLSLETPGFLPYVHGYHHEFALVKPNRWLNNHLGLCFCEHCVAGAEAAGIDARRLKAQVAADIESYLASDFDIPDDMAEAFWLSDTRGGGDLSRYLDFRCDVVTSLVSEIRGAVRDDASVAIIPSVARPSGGAWYEGSDLGALGAAAGIVEACFYEPGVARVRADVWDVKRRMAGRGQLRGVLRPAFPDLQSREDVVGAVAALAAAGVSEIGFYNYGHIRRSGLDWIRAALA